ncbi:hypothetical protein [Xanthomonas sp. 3058]|uniref:hypothetical protein n=1 Tax=Xanthomonas sp. 3058 TaxID=3035314 RepID=UPI00161D5F8E|nr:hypothetical protein [Xanthomonas sp. 3058]MBB5866193.1 hypothetical protein [Xanthomonas sp. 3058]
MSVKKRGRPPRWNDAAAGLFDMIAPEDYDRLMTAGNLEDERDVAPDAAAKLIWWAYVGHVWREKNENGKTKKTPDEVLAYLTLALTDSSHEHHAHYAAMAKEIASVVIEDAKLNRLERGKFRAALREKIVSQWDASLDKLERARKGR